MAGTLDTLALGVGSHGGGRAQVVIDPRVTKRMETLYLKGWKLGEPKIELVALVCANEACKQLTLTAELFAPAPGGISNVLETVEFWTLLPPSSAKPQPDYIPEPIRKDYYEACAIRDSSPKASATLIRRRLQGMIRDFCGISQNRLVLMK